MTDIVTECIEDITRKVKAVSAVKNKTLYLYNQEALMNYTDKVSTPCIGVLYEGLVGDQIGTRREIVAELVAQVVLIGGSLCIAPDTNIKVTSTSILDEVRANILNTVGPTEKRWKFLSETPINAGTSDSDGYLGYLQRWSTIVVLQEP